MIATEYALARTEGGDLRRASERAERALLGAVMTTGEMPRAPLSPESFGLDAHRLTWDAILTIVAGGEEPKLRRLDWELSTAHRLDLAGGAAYLAAHMDSTDCDQIDVYARIVQEAARMRKFKRTGA